MGSKWKNFVSVVVVVGLIAIGFALWASKTKAPVSDDRKQNTENSASAQNSSSADSANSTNLSSSSESSSSDSIDKVALAKFLTEKGAVMYGAYWCSHCNNEKKLFGDAFQYIKYVECDPEGPNANPEVCSAEGITGYPTWKYLGQSYSGEKTFDELAEIVGYTQASNE